MPIEIIPKNFKDIIIETYTKLYLSLYDTENACNSGKSTTS